MKCKFIVINIFCLLFVSLVVIQTSFAWNNNSYSNINNSITAEDFGLELSYISSEVIDITYDLLELEEGETYLIKSEPSDGTTLYYALKVVLKDGAYQLGYIASTSEITEASTTIFQVSNTTIQYTSVKITDGSIIMEEFFYDTINSLSLEEEQEDEITSDDEEEQEGGTTSDDEEEQEGGTTLDDEEEQEGGTTSDNEEGQEGGTTSDDEEGQEGGTTSDDEEGQEGGTTSDTEEEQEGDTTAGNEAD